LVTWSLQKADVVFLGGKIHDDVKENVFTILGTVTAFVEIKICLQGSHILPMEIALVLEAFTDSLLQFEDRVHGNLNRLNNAELLLQVSLFDLVQKYFMM